MNPKKQMKAKKKNKQKKQNKQKIKGSVANRFRITPTGKVVRRASFGRHLKRKKTKKQARRLKRAKLLTGSLAKKVKKLLGVSQ